MIIKKNIRNILISRTDRLGDVVLALPLIDEAKKIFKDAKIYFLVKKYASELIEGYEGIDELLIEENMNSFSEKYKFFKNKNLDLVINVKPRFDLALLFFIMRVKNRIGTAYRWYSVFYNMKVYEHRKDSVKHESDYNLNLLKYFFNETESGKKFHFRYSEAEKQLLNEKSNKILDKKYIVIHPGSGGSAKDVSVQKLGDFLNKFLENYTDYSVVITGIKSEINITEELMNSVSKDSINRVFNTTGSLNLRELMILIDNSKIFIANSTGPIHIAGALNKSIIGFYPNDTLMSEKRWKPLSEKVVILKPEADSDNMDQISSENILQAAKELLKN
ncbi:MAG TPA: glycosyltransferase family 9 protein [Ignavibacteria bacterium]|nr:glycosyltransferase family 9 protein [Ignavibacteria bacterium]